MLHRTARPTSSFPGRAALGAAAIILSAAWFQIASASDLRNSPIVKAVEGARESVVNIRGEKTVAATAGQAQGAETARRVNGMGTGVVIDPRGYIITNYHVVDGVRDIQVTLAGGERYIARLFARDPETDLAIIKIDPKQEIPVINIGTSSDLMTGETVIAVGNAFGYEHTVTRGIISALHRSVQVNEAQYYDDLIQTDASINPGNSGGPLLNIDGEMIGINVAVRAGAQGIGFAIPADKAVSAAASMFASSNKVWHGLVTGGEISGPAAKGILVESVEKNSPAAEAGFKPGDVIIGLDGADMHRALDLQRALLDRKPGEKIDFVLNRSGKSMARRITLASQPDVQKSPSGPVWEALGLELKPIPADEFRAVHQSRYSGGLKITAVRPNSPAAGQGIRPGDILVGMHIWETVSLDNVMYILNRPDFASFNPVTFYILRAEKTWFVNLPVGAVKTAQRQ